MQEGSWCNVVVGEFHRTSRILQTALRQIDGWITPFSQRPEPVLGLYKRVNSFGMINHYVQRFRNELKFIRNVVSYFISFDGEHKNFRLVVWKIVIQIIAAEMKIEDISLTKHLVNFGVRKEKRKFWERKKFELLMYLRQSKRHCICGCVTSHVDIMYTIQSRLGLLISNT